MNREILFRAKAINRDSNREYRTNYKNGDWVYGLVSRAYHDYYSNFHIEMTNEDGVSGIDVDYNTLGQYIGLTDKNGTKIFEGDIVKCEWGFLSNGSYHHYEDFIVEFKDSAYYIVPIKKHKNIWTVYLNPESEYEVVGNIYDTNI